MKVLRSVAELLAWRAAAEGRVAFVPTMGFLHDGHLSLMHEGRRLVPPHAGRLVISIFVNPTQFDREDDLAAYPRDEEGDLAKAASAAVDVAFCPADPQDVFPSDAKTWVEVADLDRVLCGASRPGHFRGVCTVVLKLWNLVRPDVALFGEKDYQQLTILRRMHRDLHMGGEILGMPIVREADGLAMSSRNARLDPLSRTHALALPRLLGMVRERFDAGARDRDSLLAGAAEILSPGRVDYVELVDAVSLAAVERVDGPVLCAIAVHVGGVRLIDNILLGLGELDTG